MTPIELVCGSWPTTVVDGMLPHGEDSTPMSKGTCNVWRRPASLLEFVQQLVDARHYNLPRRDIKYHPGDLVRG